MLDDLIDMLGGDGDDNNRRNGRPRQAGIRGFIARLFGGDDGDIASDSRRRGRYDGADDDDDDDARQYEGAGARRGRRRRDDDHDDDGPFSFFGD